MECNFENCPNFERLGKKFADRISELEQENAELKAYKDVNEDFKTAWEELKAENERLKECNKELTSDNLNTIQEMDNERRRVEQLKEEITELEEKFLTLNGKSYSYYKTLQLIKAIAEDAYENESEYQATGVYNEIIQMITKAEEE